MRRPVTTIVSASGCDLWSDEKVALGLDLVKLHIMLLALDHVALRRRASYRSIRPGHHVFERSAVLDAVYALRFASTARPARPSGIDGVCAQRLR